MRHTVINLLKNNLIFNNIDNNKSVIVSIKLCNKFCLCYFGKYECEKRHI